MPGAAALSSLSLVSICCLVTTKWSIHSARCQNWFYISHRTCHCIKHLYAHAHSFSYRMHLKTYTYNTHLVQADYLEIIGLITQANVIQTCIVYVVFRRSPKRGHGFMLIT